MIEYQEEDRKRAIRDVKLVIFNSLALLTPDREVAYALARFHKITAEDLLDLVVYLARRA